MNMILYISRYEDILYKLYKICKIHLQFINDTWRDM